MATITSSILVESVSSRGTLRNRYQYTLDNGETHERIGWIPVGADSNVDMTARGAIMLNEMADAEIAQILEG